MHLVRCTHLPRGTNIAVQLMCIKSQLVPQILIPLHVWSVFNWKTWARSESLWLFKERETDMKSQDIPWLKPLIHWHCCLLWQSQCNLHLNFCHFFLPNHSFVCDNCLKKANKTRKENKYAAKSKLKPGFLMCLFYSPPCVFFQLDSLCEPLVHLVASRCLGCVL